MSKIKPSLPKGTRDFGPVELRKRQYIFNTIKSVFEKYGFQPIETPVMENLSTLEGKYGEEGDKLLFRILNSGDFLKDVPDDILSTRHSSLVTRHISEKGLRYDLTIPFARYVVMHQNEITFPFKRYQIQPVWRADRPQRGRYREFFQCDADVIGSDSLLNEVELVLIYDEVFKKLGIDVTILVNDRRILNVLALVNGVFLADGKDNFLKFLGILDKLDKIGFQKVNEELENNGFRKLNEFFLKLYEMDRVSDWEKILNYLHNPETLIAGLQSITDYLRKIKSFVDSVSLKNKFVIEPFLSRGLDYYTGTIFEIKANGVQMGSIGGGGRYDNLTGVFGLEGVSGVGISFGIERIYDVMEELGLFNHLDLESSTTKVLFANFGGVNELQAFEYANKVRQQNITAEIYPASVKLDKQMKYANAKKIPFVAFVGEAELKNNTLQLKNMQTGEQFERSIEDAIKELTDSSKR